MKTQRAVSFDESSMESCSLATTTTTGATSTLPDDRILASASGNLSNSCESCESCETREIRESCCRNRHAEMQSESDVQSLEQAKLVIAALKAKQRSQAHQMMAWRRTLKLQEELVCRLTREKAEQLRSLSSQLLLFESRLCRKQKEIEANLAQRESIILRQQKVIRQLQNKLRLTVEAATTNFGSLSYRPSMRDSPPCDPFDRLDSLGDSDSAVVLEEAFHDDLTPPRFRSNVTDVTVVRSVSDAVDPSSKYSSTRRSNGFLRRPEVLETVYSVEEDGDADKSDNDNNHSATTTTNNNNNNNNNSCKMEDSSLADLEDSRSTKSEMRIRDFHGSYERLVQHDTRSEGGGDASFMDFTQKSQQSNQRPRDDNQQAQVTYNRVMSNHRSVTKPKDVKYKRINKAKSKSLEELRGRLRNWVEKGNKIAISLDQSYA